MDGVYIQAFFVVLFIFCLTKKRTKKVKTADDLAKPYVRYGAKMRGIVCY
jgi:hypothetical protein